MKRRIFDYLNGTPYDRDWAEQILKAVEAAGMCPPINKEKSFKMMPDGQLTYEVREWEPEGD